MWTSSGPGYTQVLDARLEDATFTFDRDVAVGIDELAGRLDRITFFEGGGTFADKAARLDELVGQLGGDEDAQRQRGSRRPTRPRSSCASSLSSRASSAPSTPGLAGYADDVCVAIAEHYLPDGADAPLPSTTAGRVLSAADRIDTLTVSFSLGHRPTGSRDPYGLRRAAIGLCRLAVEGGVSVSHELLATRRAGVRRGAAGGAARRARRVRPRRAPLRAAGRRRCRSPGAVPRAAGPRRRARGLHTRRPHRRRRRRRGAGRRRPARGAGGASSWRKPCAPSQKPGAIGGAVARVGGRARPRRREVLRRRARDGPGRAREGEPAPPPARRARGPSGG